MKRQKFLICLYLILAIALVAHLSGDVLAQTMSVAETNKGKDANRQEVKNNVVAKGKATRDDQAKYFGKVTPSERKEAAKRARQLGLLPGNAGRTLSNMSGGTH